jgi:hypothetical protein
MDAFISALLQSIFTGSVMFTKSLALVSRVEIKGPSCPVPSCRFSWKGGLVWYGVVGLGNKERKGRKRGWETFPDLHEWKSGRGKREGGKGEVGRW